MNKIALAYAKAEYSQTGRDKQNRQSQGNACHVAAEGEGHVESYQ